jgi:hypothetical protein
LYFVGEKTPDKVSVELTLMKTAPKKRKESSPVSNLPIGKCDVPVNPSEEHPPHKATAMSIPSESFSLKSGTQSYSLLVKVYHNTQVNKYSCKLENLTFSLCCISLDWFYTSFFHTF